MASRIDLLLSSRDHKPELETAGSKRFAAGTSILPVAICRPGLYANLVTRRTLIHSFAKTLGAARSAGCQIVFPPH